MGRAHFRAALGGGTEADFARVARWAAWATIEADGAGGVET